MGLIAQQRGDLAGSLILIQAAHHLVPSARVTYNLAVVLSGLGRTDEAITQALAAANLDPTYVPARFGLAALLVASGARPEAVGVLIGLAEQALRVGGREVARQAVNQLLALNVDHPSLLLLANMLRMAGWEADSHRLLAIRLQVAPNDIGARLTRAVAKLTPVHADETEIERQRNLYAAELAEVAELTESASPEELAIGASAIGLAQPFLLAYHGCDVRDLQCIYGSLIARLASTTTHPPVPQPKPPCDGERVRVGFASAFLHLHSVSKTHSGWMEHLDRSRFAIFGYQFSESADAVSERIASGCDSFARGIMDVAKWRARIVADAPHVLIYLDIGMEQTAVRLAALRLAPVQCTTWGHPVTSGLPTIDHYLSSEAMEPPNGDAHYTEHLVRLPGLGIYYEPPPITGVPMDRAALGLRNDAVVYLSCQPLFKYLPRYDLIWPRIAARVPAAQFLFLASHNGAGDKVFRERLERSFARAGLDWRNHCVIVPRVPAEAFSSLLRAGDVFLDSIGWSGCNSTLEAVNCGIPIVTTPTSLMRGRHSAAILACMGMADRVAVDENDYVEQAVQLTSVEARAEHTTVLGERKSRIFRDTAPIRALEAFLDATTRHHGSTAHTGLR